MPSDLPVLSGTQLRAAVLARQLLLERSALDIPSALDQVAGLQSQYAPTMYIGCWSRLQALDRRAVTDALERRVVVQGTMLRATIHLVSAQDYWPINLAIRAARRAMWLRVARDGSTEEDLARGAERVRTALDYAGSLTRGELDAMLGKRLADGVGMWIDLVRVPPSGTWDRRRADVFAAATDWLGPPPALSRDDALVHLVRRYLTGFGPASINEIANWAGMGVREIRPSLGRLSLRRFQADDGTALVDLPELPLPDPVTPMPPRFLSTWEAILLVHARRAEVLREEDRPRIFNTRVPHSHNTFLVDGQVAGTWRFEDGHVELDAWRPLPRSAMRAARDEADRLAAFHA